MAPVSVVPEQDPESGEVFAGLINDTDGPARVTVHPRWADGHREVIVTPTETTLTAGQLVFIGWHSDGGTPSLTVIDRLEDATAFSADPDTPGRVTGIPAGRFDQFRVEVDEGDPTTDTHDLFIDWP